MLFDSNYDILTPFSWSHVQDINKVSSNKEANCDGEWEFLDQLSKCNYMEYDYSKDITYPYIARAKEVHDKFHWGLNIHNHNIDSLLNALSGVTNEAVSNLVKLLLLLIPAPKLPQVPYRSSRMPSMYIETMDKLHNSSTLYHFMKHALDTNATIWGNPSKYHDYRLEVQSYLGIKPAMLSNQEDPVNLIDEMLQASDPAGVFKGLDDVFNKNNSNTALKSTMIKFTSYYLMLDMTGFHSDKMSVKNSPTNTMTDAMHSYYAAYCDYLITLDRKMAFKSKAMYDKFGIETNVCTPDEFVEEVQTNHVNYNIMADLLQEVLHNFRDESCFIAEIINHDFLDKQILLFKPHKRIFDYFNFQYIILGSNDRLTFNLRHVGKNLSKFITYSEATIIVNKFHRLLGADLYNRVLYTPQVDNEDLLNIQRYWVYEGFYIVLSFDELENSIQITIDLVNEQFVQELENELGFSERINTSD